MYMIYNGIGLEVLEIEQYTEEMVYDDTGTDYLFTKISIQGQFLVNGQEGLNTFLPVTSYDLDPTQIESLKNIWLLTSPSKYFDTNIGEPGAPSTPSVAAGSFVNTVGCETGGAVPFDARNGIYAIATDSLTTAFAVRTVVPCVTTEVTIRQRLCEPRSHLFVFTGKGDPGRKDELLLASPAFNAHCDCKNGPIPKVRAITSFHGDAQTFVVSFGIETYINEQDSCARVGLSASSGAFVGTSSPLLSNRWSMRHAIDKDSYLTIQVEGTAIFRTDLLYANPDTINPDSYRPNLLLPVPFGCVREDIQIVGLPDVTGVRYSFTDRQQHANFCAGPYANATEIEAIHRQAIVTEEDALVGVARGYEKVYSIRSLRRQAADDEAAKAAANTPKPSAEKKLGASRILNPTGGKTPPPLPKKP